MCAAALGWAQIKRVVFGAYDDRKGFTTLQDSLLHPKTEVKGGVMGDDSTELLQRFFREKRKKS